MASVHLVNMPTLGCWAQTAQLYLFTARLSSYPSVESYGKALLLFSVLLRGCLKSGIMDVVQDSIWEVSAMNRNSYPTDLTDEEWALPEPLIPPPKPGGALG